jgi:hypothetical protein
MFVTLACMSSDDSSPADREQAVSVDARAEALAAVSSALHWRLADGRWQTIDQVLVSMDTALAAGDTDAFQAAVADLELMGPLRITRIGDAPAVPPSPPVRERINQLVHSLGDVSMKEPDDFSEREGEE